MKLREVKIRRNAAGPGWWVIGITAAGEEITFGGHRIDDTNTFPVMDETAALAEATRVTAMLILDREV